MVAGPDVRRINPKYRAMSINFGRRFDANSGCWVDVGCRMLSAGVPMRQQWADVGCRMPDAGYRLPDAGCRMSVARSRMRVAGVAVPDAGRWLLGWWPVAGGGAGCRYETDKNRPSYHKT